MRKALLILTALAVQGCASVHSPEEVSARLDDAMASARCHLDRGNEPAAAQFLGTVLQIDECYPGANEMFESLSPEATEQVFTRSALGSNHARRAKTRRCGAARVFLYVPDRLLDLLDVFSFDLHVGGGLFGNLHLTRAVQAGAGGRSTAGIGWHDHRSLGTLVRTESEFTLPGVGAQAGTGLLAGTSGLLSFRDAQAGLRTPSEKLYQEYGDFWAIGLALTPGVIGIDFDLHPVELADFFTGFSTLDFLHDDFATSTGMGLSRHEESLLFRLSEIACSRQSVAAYQESLVLLKEGQTDA